jgi:HPr kinase/phosphorylase
VRERVVNVHATCVRLDRAGAPFRAPGDAGVLILGASGAGKSDLALRLIAAGAVLVADDRTELFVRRGRIHARPPKPIAGLIEVRGLGLVDIPFSEEARIALVAELTERVNRMPSPAVFRPPRSLPVPRRSWPPLLRFAAFEPSAPAKIAAAAAAFAHGGVREIVKAQ